MNEVLAILKIRALVILAVALLLIQVLFGSFRRRSSSSFVKCSLWAAFTIPALTVPYAIGLMNATQIQNKLFVVWATFLIIVFGSSSTMSAYELDDNEHWSRMKFVQLVQIFWAWWLWAMYALDLASKDSARSVAYATPLGILLLLSTFKLSDRSRASQLASLSHGARSDNKLIADYMQSEHEQEPRSEHEQEPRYDPVTMRGYQYLVAGEDLNIAKPEPPHYRMKIEKMDRVITVEKIWQCTGGLLQGPHGNKLKDVCLSFALYKLLRRRYVRYQLAESNQEKTRRFVLDGLLSGENAEERAFRVIEVELAFFYDSFFTKYPVIFSKWIRMFIKSYLLMLVCLWAVVVIFRQYRVENKDELHSVEQSINESDGNVFFDVVLTYAVVLSISAAEYWQVVAYALSDWAKVLVVWTYIGFPKLQRFYYLDLILSTLCRLRILKPWKRKLGQYSLLDSFHRNPNPLVVMIKRLLLLEKTRDGQRGDREIKLSTAVKRAVIASLKETRENLRIGTSSLEQNHVLQAFRWVFRFNHTHAHTILVWHVATEFCMLAKETTDQIRRPTWRISFRRRFMYDSDDVLVANHLSCYCAYLVAFAPELLPEHKFTTVSVFDEVIKNARQALGRFKRKSKEEKYQILREYNPAHEHEETVIAYGVKLGRDLMDKISVENDRWKVLADFWAEMVVYLAPSDDTRTHVEHLTRGGEFITHLWALLTHAGILQRQSGSDLV